METDTARPFTHAGFSAYLAEHKLMGVRCGQCAQVYLPPRELCPNCYAVKMEWVAFSGEGVLEGFSAVHVGLPAMAAAGYGREKPYCTGVVRLAEGPAISARIVAGDGGCPQDIAVGMSLRAVFIRNGPGQPATLAFTRINQH